MKKKNLSSKKLEPIISDACTPPPWNMNENPELTDKYLEVVKAFREYEIELIQVDKDE